MFLSVKDVLTLQGNIRAAIFVRNAHMSLAAAGVAESDIDRLVEEDGIGVTIQYRDRGGGRSRCSLKMVQ